jgi:hypothetical protein
MPMPESKVSADHLKRDAYLYIRQSTPRQVVEHGEHAATIRIAQ